MISLFTQNWVMIPLVSFCVFLIVYLWADEVINFLTKKSLGSREEVIKLLDLMFVEVDQKKITLLMLLISFGMGTVVFLICLPNTMAAIVLGLVVTAGGWALPMLMVRSIYEKRTYAFVDQMVDALTIMSNGIKSGLTVPQSMERVVENLKNPISQEFALVLSQIRLGRSVEEALIELGERIPRADVQMFVTSINILKETGGNLGETFQTISTTIRERQKIEKKIQAMTAQGIMQGIIITLVPIGLLVIFSFVNPGFVKPLFNTTLGLFILAATFTLQIIGGITIRKIVKINV